MAFVPGYEYDIFISYAHVDDIPDAGAEKGWVTTLINSLRTRLAQRLGRSDAFKIWMDPELANRGSLTPQILDAIRKSATIVIILSPGYLASWWCLREKNSFLESLKEGRDSRIFLVERDIIDDDDRPPEFHDHKGFRFWERDREGKPPRIFGTPEPDPQDRKYYQTVDDLTFELEDELKQLREEGAPRPSAEGKPVVYLAEVTDDLEELRNGVRRFLDQNGIAAVPNAWYNPEPEAFRISAARDMESAELFVQLLSGVSGKRPPGLPQGYARLQYDLAIAAGKPVLQWRSPTLDVAAVEDPVHRALLASVTVRAEGIEDFKAEIRKRVLEKPAPTAHSGIGAFVFVNMESVDRPIADRICSALTSRNIGYSLPVSDADPQAMRLDLEDNLLNCAGMIIVYGETTVTWVRHQLFQCQKVLALRETPLKVLAVFEGPPEKKPPLALGIPNLRVLDFRSGVDDQKLTTFIAGLNNGGRP